MRKPGFAVGIAALVIVGTVGSVSSVSSQASSAARHGQETQASPGPVAESATARQKARAFLKALLARDEEALYAYGPGFFDHGKLERVTSDFLYESDHKHGRRSVTEIAAQGDLAIIIVRQPGKPVSTVIFVPAKYKEKARSLKFLQSAWMDKYFACEFDTAAPQWKLHYNFCFSETDGPYPSE